MSQFLGIYMNIYLFFVPHTSIDTHASDLKHIEIFHHLFILFLFS